jgi:hypothetical protein
MYVYAMCRDELKEVKEIEKKQKKVIDQLQYDLSKARGPVGMRDLQGISEPLFGVKREHLGEHLDQQVDLPGHDSDIDFSPQHDHLHNDNDSNLNSNPDNVIEVPIPVNGVSLPVHGVPLPVRVVPIIDHQHAESQKKDLKRDIVREVTTVQEMKKEEDDDEDEGRNGIGGSRKKARIEETLEGLTPLTILEIFVTVASDLETDEWWSKWRGGIYVCIYVHTYIYNYVYINIVCIYICI